MGVTNRRKFLFLFIGFSLITFMGCSNSNSTEGNKNGIPEEPATRLYMISGETGSLAPATKENEYSLTLANVPPEVRWITDRPGRQSGKDTTGSFIQNIWPAIFEVTPPNAVLKFLMENENDGLFLQLKEPLYDDLKRTLILTVTLLNSTLEEGDPRMSQTMELDYPAMVILNNGDGFNFVIQSERAIIENPGRESTFSIIQEFVDETVFWVSGAPSTISRVTATEELSDKKKKKKNGRLFFLPCLPTLLSLELRIMASFKPILQPLKGWIIPPEIAAFPIRRASSIKTR